MFIFQIENGCNTGPWLAQVYRCYSTCGFLAAALAACSSSQYHVVLLVVLVPELLSKFEFFGFIGIPYVAIGLLRVNLS